MTYVYYNISNLTSSANQTTILTFVKGINDIMNYAPATLMLLAVGIVLLFALMGRGQNIFKSFTASSFVMLILTIITYGMGLVPGKVLLIFAILSPLSLFILWVWGGSEFD